MTRPLKIFLCHASQDKPEIWKLHRFLKQRGAKPWLDQEDLLPGENWEIEIPNALNNSDVILVCLSKNSIDKEGYVQKEISFALDKALEKPDGTIFIIPVKLENCELPKKLSRYQAVELYRRDGRERLLRGLNKRVQDLGSEVSPLSMEETKQRTIKPKDNVEKPEAKQAPISILPKKEARTSPRINFRALGIRGIILFGLIFLGLMTNYLIKNPPFTQTPPVESSQTPMPITIIPTPELGIGSTITSDKDNMTLAYVPAGKFTMGSETYDDEKPIHQVTLDDYWIDQTEVTNAMYKLCVDAKNCDLPSKSSSATRNNYYGNPEFNNFPVIHVSWDDANTYCTWADRRLPTEAEWEKAARGTDGRTYSWGEGINCSLANYYGKADDYCVGDTNKVSNYPNSRSIYGVLGMSGNVWEWVSSLYVLYPYNANDGRENLSSSDARVLRGGSWGIYNYDVRSANRYSYNPSYSSEYIGFRCAMDAE